MWRRLDHNASWMSGSAECKPSGMSRIAKSKPAVPRTSGEREVPRDFAKVFAPLPSRQGTFVLAQKLRQTAKEDRARSEGGQGSSTLTWGPMTKGMRHSLCVGHRDQSARRPKARTALLADTGDADAGRAHCPRRATTNLSLICRARKPEYANLQALERRTCERDIRLHQ